MAGVDAILSFLSSEREGLIFANLVDFDALYGHRNDARGYAAALEMFDQRIPEILAKLRYTDVLIITADHGNDPTTPGTDHSRERVPVLITGDRIRQSLNLDTRDSFSDVAATIAHMLGVEWCGAGTSFAQAILK